MVTTQRVFLWSLVVSAWVIAPTSSQLRWVRRRPATSPGPRYGAAVAYDLLRGRVVLFGGGNSGGAAFNDTWEWDGTNWWQLNPAARPRAQYPLNMAYDLVRGRCVLFDVGPSPGTWEWDGTNWTQAAPAISPAARWGHALVYDLNARQCVLFGGFAINSGVALADTWTWDGTSWTQMFPAQSPAARGDHVLAADLARGMLVLFGGTDRSRQNFSDTWEWDGSTWWQRSPATTPLHTFNLALAYDSTRRMNLLLGSFPSGPPPAYEWEGSDWRRCVTATSFTARSGFALAYDLARKTMVLFGGRDANGSELNETWELSIQVIPAALANQEGAGASEAPAGWVPGHMQCLYDSATVGAQPAAWNGLRFRRDRSPVTFNAHVETVQLELASQGVVPPVWSSNLYQDNRGFDQRTVFAGSFAFPALVGSTAPEPLPFNLQFPFTAPFPYAGGNLLLEITVAGTAFLDTGWRVDATADVPVNPGGTSGVVGAGCPSQFSTALAGLAPWPGVPLRVAGSSGAPGPVAAIHVLGGGPLALDLGGVGMPGCHLYQTPLVFTAGSTDPVGDFRADWGRVPTDPALRNATLLLQSFVRDPAFNAAGLRASAGLRVVLGAGFPPGMATFSWFDRRPTTALPPAADFGSTRVPVVEMY